jgi:hypothetical protein
MLSYPDLQAIGKLKPGYTLQQGCPDNVTGHVYFQADPNSDDSEQLVEYPTGGTTQVGVLQPPSGYAFGNCNADPTTSNLAVITTKLNTGGGYITVYPAGSGEPQAFINPAFQYYMTCSYDSSGNLFVVGEKPGSGWASLAELPKNGSTFVDLSLNQHIGFGFLQWDGRYILSQAPPAHRDSPLTMYRIAISGTNANVVSKSTFKHAASEGWIQGNAVISPEYGKRNISNLAFYKYPKGGRPKAIYAVKPGEVFYPFVATSYSE